MSGVASRTLRVACPTCGRQATLTIRRTFHDLEHQDVQIEIICPGGCNPPQAELRPLLPRGPR